MTDGEIFQFRTSSSRNSFTEEESDGEENSFVIKKVSSSRKKSYKKWIKEEVKERRIFIFYRNYLLRRMID